MNGITHPLASMLDFFRCRRLCFVALLTLNVITWCGDNAKGAAYEFVRSIGTLGSGNGQFNLLNLSAGLALWNGGILVADSGNNRIQKFDWDGNYVDQFGDFGTGAGQFIYPQGIATNGSYIVVADSANNRVQQFDMEGNYVTEYHESPWSHTPFFEPWAVAIGNLGEIVVADTGNGRVVGLNFSGPDFSLVPFEVTSEFPVGVAVTSHTIESLSTIWIADAINGSIARFDTSGFQISPVIPYSGLSSIALDTAEYVWAGDFSIQAYDNSGARLVQFGTNGTGPGQFQNISGIAVDYRGHVWVADSSLNRVLEFQPVPEPSGIALAATALVGLIVLGRRKRAN